MYLGEITEVPADNYPSGYFFEVCPYCGEKEITKVGYRCGLSWVFVGPNKIMIRSICQRYKPFKFIPIEAVQSLDNINSWIRSM